MLASIPQAVGTAEKKHSPDEDTSEPVVNQITGKKTAMTLSEAKQPHLVFPCEYTMCVCVLCVFMPRVSKTAHLEATLSSSSDSAKKALVGPLLIPCVLGPYSLG